MPLRQETFKLVPTTLVNKSTPRPPMTSKAAKKAYREANKLPKMSRAEQRRLAAEEIAQQKREYEKERAAAKAKAAREKKLKKESEERDKRKKLGLPKPSRYVRPSQPTIKRFVNLGTGKKRTWEEVDSMANDQENDGEVKLEHEGVHDEGKESEAPPALQHADDDDEFGDFPSLSQVYLPALFDTPDERRTRTQYQTPIRVTAHVDFSNRADCVALPTNPQQNGVFSPIKFVKDLPLDSNLVGMQLPVVTKIQRKELTNATHNAGPSKKQEIKQVHSSLVSSAMCKTDCASTNSFAVKKHEPGKLSRQSLGAALSPSLSITVDGLSRTMPPPPLFKTVNSLRTPLVESSANMGSPTLSRRSMHKKSTSTVLERQTRQTDSKKSKMVSKSIAPSSTMRFLEAHLDDFFPSPTQQVRELLEEVDDIPSNTQIAREIDLDDGVDTAQISLLQTQLNLENVEVELSCWTAQEFDFSSQDLRDINTPSKAAIQEPCRLASTDRDLGLTGTSKVPPCLEMQPKKHKPRFFEEKEEDLYVAALHESLITAKRDTLSSSPRRPQRIARKIEQTKIEPSEDDNDCEDFDDDPEFLAALDNVEV